MCNDNFVYMKHPRCSSNSCTLPDQISYCLGFRFISDMQLVALAESQTHGVVLCMYLVRAVLELTSLKHAQVVPAMYEYIMCICAATLPRRVGDETREIEMFYDERFTCTTTEEPMLYRSNYTQHKMNVCSAISMFGSATALAPSFL